MIPSILKSKGTCKPGQTAATTGCTPASGESTPKDKLGNNDKDFPSSNKFDFSKTDAKGTLGDKLRIDKQSINSEDAVKTIDQVQRNIPASMLKEGGIERIEMFDNPEDASKRAKEILGDEVSDEEIARGFFDRKSGLLVCSVYSPDDNAATGRNIYHEFAHSLESYINSDEWQETYHEWNLDPDESFAEAFSEFMVSKQASNLEEFKEKYPETYQLFDQWNMLSTNEPIKEKVKPKDKLGDSTNSVKQSVLNTFNKAVESYTNVKETAAELGNIGFDLLPDWAQQSVARVYGAGKYVEHKLMLGYKKSKELAEQVAKERGMDEEQAKRLGKILGTVDLVMGWTVQAPLIGATTGSLTAMKIGTWIPAASLGYIAYSTARNPLATVRAAKKLIGKKPVEEQKMIARVIIRKGKGTCKPGETSAKTGCTPASGESRPEDNLKKSEDIKGIKVSIDKGIDKSVTQRLTNPVDRLVNKFGSLVTVRNIQIKDVDSVTQLQSAEGSETFGYYDKQSDKIVIAAGRSATREEQVAARGGSQVDPSIEGTYRHESGHGVYNKMGGFNRAEWEGVHNSIPENFELSTIASQDPEEFFCEAFSLYTSPDWEEGELPNPVVRFFQSLEASKQKYLLNIVNKEAHWITINSGKKRGEEGGGTHVLVDGGTVVGGPAALTGRPLNRLSGKQPGESNHKPSQPSNKLNPNKPVANKPTVKPPKNKPVNNITEPKPTQTTTEPAESSTGFQPEPSSNEEARPTETTPQDTHKPIKPKQTRTPVTQHEATRRIDRYQKFFNSKGMHEQAGWMNKLKEHISSVGTDEALKQLGEKTGEDGREDVQYEGGWAGENPFIAQYLDRYGITMLNDNDQASDDVRMLSSMTPAQGGRSPGGKNDFKPSDATIGNKLAEAKALPGLETSEDINKVMGDKVTHITPDVVSKMDEKYGKGAWIIKSFGDDAFAGYGIYFPQYAAKVSQDARNTIWTAGQEIGKYGFKLGRDKSGKVFGVIHDTGDIYQFDTDEYDDSINGDVKNWAERAKAAADNEKGAKLSSRAESASNVLKTASRKLNKYGFKLDRDKDGNVDGIVHEGGDRYKFDSDEYNSKIHGAVREWADNASKAANHENEAKVGKPLEYMAQPAFPVVGISEEERARGVTIKKGLEGRTHITTKNGKATLVPHSTWLKETDLIG